MGSRGRPLFDLNETPIEVDEEIDDSSSVQPQKVLPSLNSCTSDLLVSSVAPSSIVNNNAFSHASSVSGFQPFVKLKESRLNRIVYQKMARDMESYNVSLPEVGENTSRKELTRVKSSIVYSQAIEKEGEWSDGECSEPLISQRVEEKSSAGDNKDLNDQGVAGVTTNNSPSGKTFRRNSRDSSRADSRIIPHDYTSARSNNFPNDITGGTSQNLNGNAERNSFVDLQGDSESVLKQKEVKGVEAMHALKCTNSPGKHKLDEHKEAMLGKKRSRKTMFLNIEDAKQAGAVKSSTPKRHTVPTPSSARPVKGTRNLRLPECNGEKQNEHCIRDQDQADLSYTDQRGSMETADHKSESSSDVNAGLVARPRRLNSYTDLSAEGNIRNNSLKHPTDPRQFKDPQTQSRKVASSRHGSGLVDVKPLNKKNPPKRQLVTNHQYQDTSVERLLREVTSKKFWHNPVG